MSSHTKAIAALGCMFSLTAALTAATVGAQGAQSAPPSSKAVVMKGKAPVNEKVLDVKLPKPVEGDLPNGIHLIVLEDHRAAQVTFQLVVTGAGGYFDAPNSIGLASATAAMMREGTATRTTTQIAEQLETTSSNVAVTTGMTSLDANLSGSALTENIDKLFELASDVLLHPSFPEEELAKYKTRTKTGLNQNRANPGFLAAELNAKVMYGDDPAGRLLMTPEQLDKVTRAAMIAFHQAKYVPDHAAIAFAGDISYAKAKQLVESRLGEWKKTGAPMVAAKDPPPIGPAKVWLVDRPNSVQTNFIVGTQAIERTNPDYDVLDVMNQVVGGGPTGRLFVHLREEKGYTYGAYSGLSAGRYRGTWSAQTDVRSEVTEPALRDLLSELVAIRDTIVPAKELADRKRSLVASFALSLESPQQVLSYYVTRWIYKLPADYWDKYPQRVMSVSAAQVQAAAKKYLDPSRVQIVAVGDGKKVEEILRKFGKLEVYDTEGKKVMGGGAVNRIPVRAAAAWIAAALLLFPFQRRLDGSIRASSAVAGTESAAAGSRIRSGFDSPFGEPALLVVSGLYYAADTDRGRALMRVIAARLLATGAATGVLSPGSSLDTLLVGSDRTTALVIVGVNSAVPDAMDALRRKTASLARGNPGMVLRWTGEPALVGDLRTMGAREARRSELRALPISIVVSVVAFGSLLDALIAVGSAALAISVALGVMGLLSGFVPASSFTRTLVPLIGLALTVDYALYLARRAQSGGDTRFSRRTVALAAGVVALGFTGLALAPTGELRQAALAGIITCAMAALAAITLRPAARAGAPAAAAVTMPGPRWMRWGAFVVRRPWLVLAASALPLLLLANAARSARLITPLDELLPAGMESADAFRDLQRASRAGVATMLRVVLEMPDGTAVMTDAGWSALTSATHALHTMDGVADARSITSIGNGDLFVAKNVLPAAVAGTFVSRDGRATLIDVIPDLSRGSDAVLDLVKRVRALDASAVTGVRGARFSVAGLPAYALDYQTAIGAALPWIVFGTSLATLLALLAAFRAPVVALKAVALNLLVAAAAIGATVLVFQDGFGAALIGQHALGSIFPTVPALAFGAAFGTSMDYELFLLGAVREARREGRADSDAIVVGLARTGGLITRAAAVMACLFLAFSTSGLLPLAMVGFALAVAVALDATLVRLALAPSMLQIAGRWNWWPGN